MTHELLTVDNMYEADRLTMESHCSGLELMEAAGTGCAHAIAERWDPGAVTVLCGPGNNGGDGFVIARHLSEMGWRVRLALLGEVDALKGDAAAMAAKWEGVVLPLTPEVIDGADLVVDALFGAGLSKPVEGLVADVLSRIEMSGAAVMAVDVPSGLDGNTGDVLGGEGGMAQPADLTVTFGRKKQGHVLMPGRAYCGETVVVDIGIPDFVIDQIACDTQENDPDIWWSYFPQPNPLGHKYTRGHALIVSGGMSTTGASRLAARGALRMGAGLVTVASPKEALMVNAAQLLSVMVRPFQGTAGLQELLSDERKNALAIGPGCGVTAETRDLVRAILGTGRACVLDADALTVFQEAPQDLFALCHEGVVLTPHEGEFDRLFPNLLEASSSRLEAALEAAELSGATLVLKGPDTVIAEPNGHAVINAMASPALATAGTGDVLTGFITGLLAQDMPAFEASCAGVWLHGACSVLKGRGLIAEDLPEVLPDMLQKLEEEMGA